MKELEEIIKTSTNLTISKKTILNLILTSTVFKDDMQSVLKPFDLSMEQFNVLRILRGQEGKSINLQDIQERMVTKMSNTTRLVDKLIKKNYVKRFICKQNRRKVEIFITDQGLDLLKELDSIVEDNETKLVSSLSQTELEQLNKLLNKLRTQS